MMLLTGPSTSGFHYIDSKRNILESNKQIHKNENCWSVEVFTTTKYRIRSNYRTYPYKRTVKKFRSLQITASVLFLYFFIKAYVVGTHLNCTDLSMQFK